MTGRRATVVQSVGGVVAAAGLYSLVGPAWTALAAGLSVMALGTLAELAPPKPKRAAD